VQVTNSYDDPTVIPQGVRSRYVWIETGNAAAILQATCFTEFSDLMGVLSNFKLSPNRWLVAGGNKGDIAGQLDGMFRRLGWKETRIDVSVRGMFLTDWTKRGNTYVASTSDEVPTVYSEGYRVDNHKGRMIVDIEWNAKDGNLDRDLSAYRSWYEYGLINGAVIITKDRLPLLKLGRELWRDYQATTPAGQPLAKFPIDLTTSTTTSFDKAEIRIKRAGAGTCPVLIVGVSEQTWDGTPFSLEPDNLDEELDSAQDEDNTTA